MQQQLLDPLSTPSFEHVRQTEWFVGQMARLSEDEEVHEDGEGSVPPSNVRDNKVPRPPNMFIVFTNVVSDPISLPKSTSHARKGLAWKWKTADQKAPYVRAAAELAAAHGRKYPLYQYKPGAHKKQKQKQKKQKQRPVGHYEFLNETPIGYVESVVDGNGIDQSSHPMMREHPSFMVVAQPAEVKAQVAYRPQSPLRHDPVLGPSILAQPHSVDASRARQMGLHREANSAKLSLPPPVTSPWASEHFNEASGLSRMPAPTAQQVWLPNGSLAQFQSEEQSRQFHATRAHPYHPTPPQFSKTEMPSTIADLAGQQQFVLPSHFLLQSQDQARPARVHPYPTVNRAKHRLGDEQQIPAPPQFTRTIVDLAAQQQVAPHALLQSQYRARAHPNRADAERQISTFPFQTWSFPPFPIPEPPSRQPVYAALNPPVFAAQSPPIFPPPSPSVFAAPTESHPYSLGLDAASYWTQLDQLEDPSLGVATPLEAQMEGVNDAPGFDMLLHDSSATVADPHPEFNMDDWLQDLSSAALESG